MTTLTLFVLMVALSISTAQNTTTMTTTTRVMTSQGANGTTTNMTSATQTQTTHNVTTAITEIMTSIATENVTTIEMTTATTPPTTEPGPTPCAAAHWTVRNSDKDVCMLMSFDGWITYQGNEYHISNKTSTQGSSCEGKSASFNLWYRQETIWHIILSFTKEGSKYELGRVTIELYTNEGILIQFESVKLTFFTVPIGQHYTCVNFTANLGIMGLVLTSPILQPFVRDTPDQCGLGEPFDCSSGGEPSSNLGLIIGCVIGGVIVVAAGGLVAYTVIKKRRQTQSYTAFS